MSSIAPLPTSSSEEFGLGMLVRVLWRSRYLVALATVLTGAAAAGISLLLTPMFRAEVVIIEVRDPTLGGGMSLPSQISGLASLAGVNLGAVGEGGQDAQAVLDSRRLVEQFVGRNELIPQLFPNAKKAPSLWRAVRHFKEKVLSIRHEARRGVTVVSIKWTDPAVAAKWANGIVAFVNDLMRARALAESGHNVKYLEEQLARTDVVELRRVMYNLIEGEMKTLMLANAREEYAFKVIDPAVEPEVRFSPRRTLMTLFGLVLGFCIGAGVALVRNSTGRDGSARAI